MEFWLWMPQLFACTRARIKTQINRGLSPIIILSPIIPPGITLREMKHSYPGGNRVLSLLVLESAAPKSFGGSGWENEHSSGCYERFSQ